MTSALWIIGTIELTSLLQSRDESTVRRPGIIWPAKEKGRFGAAPRCEVRVPPELIEASTIAEYDAVFDSRVIESEKSVIDSELSRTGEPELPESIMVTVFDLRC